MIAQTKSLSGKKENISSLRHIDSEEMTHQLFLRNLYFRIAVRKKIKLYQSSPFVIYPNCTKLIKLYLNASFLKKIFKKISVYIGSKKHTNGNKLNYTKRHKNVYRKFQKHVVLGCFRGTRN